jgi:hypothetical protein
MLSFYVPTIEKSDKKWTAAFRQSKPKHFRYKQRSFETNMPTKISRGRPTAINQSSNSSQLHIFHINKH